MPLRHWLETKQCRERRDLKMGKTNIMSEDRRKLIEIFRQLVERLPKYERLLTNGFIATLKGDYTSNLSTEKQKRCENCHF